MCGKDILFLNARRFFFPDSLIFLLRICFLYKEIGYTPVLLQKDFAK
jgi:hypothetical protein